MIKRILLILGLLSSLNFYAQINYEKAYFIDNKDLRIECFIKNVDWQNNPTKFEYKNTENDASGILKDIVDVKEFGIGDFHRYLRAEVMIDNSEVNSNKLGNNPNPEWVKKTLFLKILIQGNPILYEYVGDNSNKYFYSVDNAPIEQLIFKKYYTENNSYIAQNNGFQRQLWAKAKCEDAKTNELLKLKYDRESLIKYFVKVNACNSQTITNYTENRKNDIISPQNGEKNNISDVKIAKNDSFKIKLVLGLNASPNKDSNNADFTQLYIGKNMFPKYGVEAGYIFPFNKNKWSTYLETSYQQYEFKSIVTDHYYYGPEFDKTHTYNEAINYFVINAGFRHYMYLNQNLAISLGFSVSFNQMNDTYKEEDGIEFKTKGWTNGPTFSVGMNYRKKYHLELRRLDGYANYSLVFGYTIFNNKNYKK